MGSVKKEPFVHLHLHTSYSLLDGAARIDQVMETALEYGMPAVAMTDHGVMYGTVDFYKAAQSRGIKPVIGCETYITRGSRFDRGGEERTPSFHLVLLAENETGYSNLIRLVSSAHLEGFYYKPRIDMEILSQFNKGLIGLSACLKGEVNSRLMEEDFAGAVRAAGEYADVLGKNNFFLEIQDHGLPEQRKVNSQIRKLSEKTGLPIVATNDAHYLKKEHAAAHEVLLCLQTQTVMSDPKRMRYRTQEFYFKTREEMEALFREFEDAVRMPYRIAERCNVELEFGKRHFPVFKLPDGVSQKDYLLKLGHEGLRNKYRIENPDKPAGRDEKQILDRFNHELSVIENTGFVNYFLVVWDFVRFAHENNIPVGPGRGSGGGSIVAYTLGITAIDPLRYGLIFERFLNPERISPPDFDIDFCQARRGEVIEYVKNKYGRENVAQIVTFQTLGAKTVIRDVGRVLEIPYTYCDRLSKMVPEDPKISLHNALEINGEFKKCYESEADCKRILDYAFVLEGLSRNQGTHAAGVVIGEKKLSEIIPLSRDKDNQPVTQFTMEPLDEIGLLKMDFLGLKTLTVIRETLDLIRESSGKSIDLDSIPLDDKPTYELFNRGDTVGVFQLESGGMRDLIRKVRIDNIEDLIAMIALYRPGPMNMLEDYVNRKSGKAAVNYDHKLLEPVLKETYGVMVYQEQVQKAANLLAGYSLGEADILRRAMGKKKQDVMNAQRAKFIEGCGKTARINKQHAGRIFDTMAKFAGYGFNKAHSAGYAIIAFQTAYLKANYPAEFMSALISSEIGNFDKMPVFINEAREMGLEIMPPDVNTSRTRFKPSGKSIYFGLAGIKNVGEGATEALVKERDINGPFKSLVDICGRLDSQTINKKVLESLAKSGAFDCFNMHRARIFNGIDFAMARSAEALRDRQTGQGSLFDLMGSDAKSPETAGELPETEPWKENELLAGEKELLGIYMSGHPLTQYSYLLEHYQLARMPGLPDIPDRTLTRIGGIISILSKKITRNKEAMAILQLENMEGVVEVVVYPEAYARNAMHLAADAAVLICGEVSRREEQPKIIASEVYPLADAPRHFATKVSIHIPAAHMEDGRLEEVKSILRMHPGNVPVMLCLIFPSGEKVFINTDRTFNVFPDEELVKKLEQLLGEKSVFVAISSSPCKNSPRQRRFPDKRP